MPLYPAAAHVVGNFEGEDVVGDCERLEKCRYFNEQLKDLKAVQEMWKRKFCKDDNSKCARYMVLKALGADRIPKYLVPTQVDKAKELIEESLK